MCRCVLGVELAVWGIGTALQAHGRAGARVSSSQVRGTGKPVWLWLRVALGTASSLRVSPPKNRGWHHCVARAPGRSRPRRRYECSVSARP